MIDARGPGDLSTLELGWQKFVGRELDARGAARPRPPGGDGRDRRRSSTATASSTACRSRRRGCSSRTPITATRPSSTAGALDARIDDYAAAHGWAVARRSTREEAGRAAGRDGRRLRGVLALGRRARSPRRGCAPGCSTRPPAIRCPTRCGTAVHDRRPHATSRETALHDADLRSRQARRGTRAASTGCSTQMLFRAAEPDGALPRARTLLPARPRADRALLRRAIDDGRQGAHPDGQAAGAVRARGARGAGGASR